MPVRVLFHSSSLIISRQLISIFFILIYIMMFMFCVKTGILFLILCEASGLPHGGDGKKLEHQPGGESEAADKHADGKKIDGKRVGVDVERARTVKEWLPRRLGDSKRPKRTPNGFPDEDEDTIIEPRFGGRGFQKGDHPHGFLGHGHPGRGHWGYRHGPPKEYNHPIFGFDHHPVHHDPNFGHHGPNYGHHGPNFDRHGPNFDQHDTSFNHHPEWHKDHPQFDHNHHNCNHDHSYGQLPWNHNFSNGENTSKYPMTTNTLSAGGKTNNEGFGDVKPVSEPNSDIDETMGGIFTSSVTMSTKYPDIDIRAGV
ncbi:unnamed protein product [Psylliodes chrysocephalus]|uniref:Uncharacterized protein n=1 Tax=Psylliodes chrysocephalus TaxID=3402493 RepID=A0A9P0CHJ5_9CUCU|nr:unnamed protein product [Psylliodes chrysocephala]